LQSRLAADDRVSAFLQATTFHAGDFTRVSDGLCRLHPQLARSSGDGRGATVSLGAACCMAAKAITALRPSHWRYLPLFAMPPEDLPLNHQSDMVSDEAL
jgi:hypothetical protein